MKNCQPQILLALVLNGQLTSTSITTVQLEHQTKFTNLPPPEPHPPPVCLHMLCGARNLSFHKPSSTDYFSQLYSKTTITTRCINTRLLYCLYCADGQLSVHGGIYIFAVTNYITEFSMRSVRVTDAQTFCV